MRNLVLAALLFLFTPVVVTAQENPYSTHARGLYHGIQKIVLRSAELMPEENYSFKPTESVRAFGQILGHIADAQYLFCSRVRGEKNPALKIEETKSSKADLTAALKDAFAYCNKAYEGVDDARIEPVHARRWVVRMRSDRDVAERS